MSAEKKQWADRRRSVRYKGNHGHMVRLEIVLVHSSFRDAVCLARQGGYHHSVLHKRRDKGDVIDVCSRDVPYGERNRIIRAR